MTFLGAKYTDVCYVTLCTFPIFFSFLSNLGIHLEKVDNWAYQEFLRFYQVERMKGKGNLGS